MAATKKYLVRGFISSWLDKSGGGMFKRTWLSSDPKDTKRAQCLVCKNIDCSYKTFSITEGYTAITQHLSGKKHKYNFNEVQTNPMPIIMYYMILARIIVNSERLHESTFFLSKLTKITMYFLIFYKKNSR